MTDPGALRLPSPREELPDVRGVAVEDALAVYEDALRAQLPTADEILAGASARQHRVKRQRRAAGATVAAVGLAVLVWLDPAYKRERFATAVGQRGEWRLPDGSQLRLNTASEVVEHRHLRSRRFTLDGGEASFTVAHAPWRAWAPWAERAFVVQAGDVRVEDIGTVFTVRRAEDDSVRVTVQQGRVRVSRAAGEGAAADRAWAGELGEGEGVALSATGATPLDPSQVGRATAWHDGRLLFDATPLDEVLAEVRRHRVAPLGVAPGVDGGLRVSGQFEIARIEQLIDLLPTLAPVRVQRTADDSVRVSPAR